MVDVLAFFASPLGGPALEFVPCLGFAVLGLSAGWPPRPIPPPPGEALAVARPATHHPWVAPAET